MEVILLGQVTIDQARECASRTVRAELIAEVQVETYAATCDGIVAGLDGCTGVWAAGSRSGGAPSRTPPVAWRKARVL